MSAWIVRGGTRTWLVRDAASAAEAKMQVVEQVAPHGRDGRLNVTAADLSARHATPEDVDDFGNPHLRWETKTDG